MDHLPQQHSLNDLGAFPRIPVIQAPTHSSRQLSTCSVFETSPSLAFELLRSTCRTTKELAHCTQHFFFFQLLSEVTEQHHDPRLWTKGVDQATSVLNTQPLGALLKHLRHALLQVASPARQLIGRRIQRLLTFAAEVCNLVCDSPALDSAADSVLEVDEFEANSPKKLQLGDDQVIVSIIFSIRILIATFYLLLRSAYPDSDGLISKLCPPLKEVLPLTRARKRAFVDLAWCPHQVQTIWNDYPCIVGLYLLSFVRKCGHHRDHSPCLQRTTCVANAPRSMEDRVHHVNEGCTCSPVAVDEKQIASFIEAGAVPVISAARMDEACEHKAEVIKRAANTRYIAISHVWSDGLGNPSQNALSQCVFNLLKHRLKTMPKSFNPEQFEAFGIKVDWPRQSFVRSDSSSIPPFWMDVFSVPVSDKYLLQRNKAVNQMASIYAGAEQVLVLDAELQDHQVATAPALEVLALIVNSNWMTRSWTLQEGVLGRECVFQFRDVAIDPIHMWSLGGLRDINGSCTNLFPSTQDVLQAFVYQDLYNVLWDKLREDSKHSVFRESNYRSLIHGGPLTLEEARKLSGIRRVLRVSYSPTGQQKEGHFEELETDASRCKQLVSVWNELTKRSTSKQEDVQTIMANLLDFHLQKIQRVGTDTGSLNPAKSKLQTNADRIRTMLLSFKLLPLSLLYQEGSELQPKGLEWVPIAPVLPLVHPEDTMLLENNKLFLCPQAAVSHRCLLFQWTSFQHAEVVLVDPLTFKAYRFYLESATGISSARDVGDAGKPHTYCIVLSDTRTPCSQSSKMHCALLQVVRFSAGQPKSDLSRGITLQAHYNGRVLLEEVGLLDNNAARPRFATRPPHGWHLCVNLGRYPYVVVEGVPWSN